MIIRLLCDSEAKWMACFWTLSWIFEETKLLSLSSGICFSVISKQWPPMPKDGFVMCRWGWNVEQWSDFKDYLLGIWGRCESSEKDIKTASSFCNIMCNCSSFSHQGPSFPEPLRSPEDLKVWISLVDILFLLQSCIFFFKHGFVL